MRTGCAFSPSTDRSTRAFGPVCLRSRSKSCASTVTLVGVDAMAVDDGRQLPALRRRLTALPVTSRCSAASVGRAVAMDSDLGVLTDRSVIGLRLAGGAGGGEAPGAARRIPRAAPARPDGRLTSE